jgi:hypothetical protein
MTLRWRQQMNFGPRWAEKITPAPNPVKNLKPAITNRRPRSASSVAWKFLPGSLFVSLLFAGKRLRKSSCGQIIRVHVSPPGMLSKVLNNYVCNLAHANVSPGTNDMHAIKQITHAREVPKAIKLFRCVIRIIKQGVGGIEGRES